MLIHQQEDCHWTIDDEGRWFLEIEGFDAEYITIDEEFWVLFDTKTNKAISIIEGHPLESSVLA